MIPRWSGSLLSLLTGTLTVHIGSKQSRSLAIQWPSKVRHSDGLFINRTNSHCVVHYHLSHSPHHLESIELTYPIRTDSFYALAGEERVVEDSVNASLNDVPTADKMALVLFQIRESISTLGDDAEWTSHNCGCLSIGETAVMRSYANRVENHGTF